MSEQKKFEGRIDLSDLMEELRLGRKKKQKAEKVSADVRELERQIMAIDNLVEEIKRERPLRIAHRENIAALERQKVGIQKRIDRLKTPEVPTEYDPLTLRDWPKYGYATATKHFIERLEGERWVVFDLTEAPDGVGENEWQRGIRDCGDDMRKIFMFVRLRCPRDTFRIGRVVR